MKRFLFFVIAKAMLGLTFTSCDKEKEDDSKKTVSLNGRWDGVPEGVEVGKGEQRITLIFDGDKVEVYIVAWGDHLKGTYTYADDKLNFSFKIEDAWDALIVEDDYWGWSMSDGALDPETFELTYTEELPYRWYQMKQDQFDQDVDFLKDFTFKIVNEKKAVGGPMNLEFIKR